MEPLDFSNLPDRALLLLDSAPIIYVLEADSKFASRFEPLFDAHVAGRVRFAVTPITIAEVLTGPFQAGDESLARRYRSAFETWDYVDLNVEIAENAARLCAQYRLPLADAIQAACALAINAAALVTHDRDFSRMQTLRVIC
jgi:predicted nucleic acid-binding protein